MKYDEKVGCTLPVYFSNCGEIMLYYSSVSFFQLLLCQTIGFRLSTLDHFSTNRSLLVRRSFFLIKKLRNDCCSVLSCTVVIRAHAPYF